MKSFHISSPFPAAILGASAEEIRADAATLAAASYPHAATPEIDFASAWAPLFVSKSQKRATEA